MLRILGRTASINVRKVLCTATKAGLDFDYDALWPGTESPATPSLLAYRARLQARPAVRRWIDPETP